MNYVRGERVRILGKPEWGPGFIQGKSKNGKVNVDFQQVGKKTLSLKHAKLMKVALRPAWELEQKRIGWVDRYSL